VANHGGASHFQRSQDPVEVAENFRHAVCVHLGWARGTAEAAEIGHNHPMTRWDQGRHLMTPQTAGVGEAVQEQGRGSIPVALDV
jgi:hypothetical protein